jgi:predicted DNA-binding transcriptional regulator AlpA
MPNAEPRKLLLADQEVAERLGIGRSTLWKVVKRDPAFPCARHLPGLRRVAWIAAEVDDRRRRQAAADDVRSCQQLRALHCRWAAALPEVPTSAEAGLPAFEVLTWFGLFGPAGMPAEIVTTLNRRPNVGLAERATVERLARLGLDPAAAYLKADSEKWAEVIRRIGLVVD